VFSAMALLLSIVIDVLTRNEVAVREALAKK
jgi:hypothetical protein